MKILDFNIDLNLIIENQKKLFDLNQIQMYKNHEKELTFLIDYLDESFFLDPTLFYYFLEKNHKLNVLQIASGYLSKNKLAFDFLVTPDKQRTVYIPNCGYLKIPNNMPIVIKYNGSSVNKFSNENNSLILNSEKKLVKSGIVVCEYTPLIITENTDIELNEDIKLSVNRNLSSLEKAMDIISTTVPDLYHLITLTTKTFTLYKNDTLNSFAAISQHGASFINIRQSDNNLIFFIEDIAHQCGHIIFNTLTLETEKYLTFPKNALMKDLIADCTDSRTIYSGFHGLFTYSCILNSFDSCITKSIFKIKEQDIELYARLGFYLGKMSQDLHLLYNKGLFTQDGKSFFEQFVAVYKSMYNKYYPSVQQFNYTNQPYVFNINNFLEINSN